MYHAGRADHFRNPGQCVRYQTLRPHGSGPVDISEVTHLDSSGCGEVISAHTSIHRAKGLLGFVNPTAQVRLLWTHTRLIEVLNIFESIDDAHEFLRR